MLLEIQMRLQNIFGYIFILEARKEPQGKYVYQPTQLLGRTRQRELKLDGAIGDFADPL